MIDPLNPMRIKTMVYTVTTLDLRGSDNILGYQKTPAIFTILDDAIFAVQNNLNDLSDEGNYQYAVIEKNWLNEVRPLINDDNNNKMWFRYNSILDEFEMCAEPKQFARVNGFGIG
jgi:hypothetical protein